MSCDANESQVHADPALVALLLACALPPLGEPWEPWHTVAQPALADWLEERGDARADTVRHSSDQKEVWREAAVILGRNLRGWESTCLRACEADTFRAMYGDPAPSDAVIATERAKVNIRRKVLALFPGVVVGQVPCRCLECQGAGRTRTPCKPPAATTPALTWRHGPCEACDGTGCMRRQVLATDLVPPESSASWGTTRSNPLADLAAVSMSIGLDAVVEAGAAIEVGEFVGYDDDGRVVPVARRESAVGVAVGRADWQGRVRVRPLP